MIISSRLKSYLRILVGIVFLFSAVAKLFTIDTFEIYLFRSWMLKLDYAYFLARMIIAGELFLGILLSTGIWQKKTNQISIGILSLFSIYIVYLILNRSDEHCHCFGDLKLTNEISLAKNLILILLLIISKNGNSFSLPYKKLIISSGIILSLIPPLILFPPDTFLYKKYSQDVSYNKSYLMTYLEDNANLMEGKHIVCFFSTGCKFCKLAAQKISVIQEKTGRHDIVTIVFAGSLEIDKMQDSVDDFFSENYVQFQNYQFVLPNRFLKITNGSMPLILLIENGLVVGQHAYRDLVEGEIIEFINE